MIDPEWKTTASSAVEVGGCNAEWNAQFLKGPDFQDAVQERHHAIVRSKSVTRECPACECREAAAVSDADQFFDGNTTAIQRPYQRADAGPGHDLDWNAFFFEDSENADMSDAPGETSTKGNTDGRNALDNGRSGLPGKPPSESLYGADDLSQTHGAPHLRPHVLQNSSRPT